MIFRKARKVTVGNVAVTNLRETGARPVALSQLYYASGGGAIEISNDAAFAAGSGFPVPAGEIFTCYDNSPNLYARVSTGTQDIWIADYES